MPATPIPEYTNERGPLTSSIDANWPGRNEQRTMVIKKWPYKLRSIKGSPSSGKQSKHAQRQQPLAPTGSKTYLFAFID